MKWTPIFVKNGKRYQILPYFNIYKIKKMLHEIILLFFYSLIIELKCLKISLVYFSKKKTLYKF
jgi:hypothetical protein